MRIAVLIGTLVTIAVPFVGCTDSGTKVQEPVAPTEEQTGYPEDPDLAGPPPAPTEDIGDEVAGAPTNDAPGSLTDDPFGAPKTDPAAEPGPDVVETTPPAMEDEPAIPSPDTGDAAAQDPTYGNAFEEKPGFDPSLDAEPEVEERPATVQTPKASKGKAAKAAKASKSKAKSKAKASKVAKVKVGKSSTRYVNAVQLNVRHAPDLRAPIIRRILGGSEIKAAIGGDWAKIGDNEWVRSKYLSKKPTKTFTEEDAAKAWEKSKYKDTWQPQQ